MLSVENLSVRFRQHSGARLTPLAGVSLQVARGEVVGLVGGSGAGKTLLAEALLGLLPRNAEVSGRATIDGQAPQRGALALAPQALDALDPLARLGVQVERFAQLANRQVDPTALLGSLGLNGDAVRAYPHQLSGGMAKRALLATALATGAEFLIADEPTLGLDPELADSLMALFTRLAGEGRGVLVISHDLPRLVRISARVTILQEGRMVETAPSTAFAAGTLAHPFTRALWAAQTWSAPCS
jgi:peptide/nickel transport system ATP-binding protein